MKYFVIKLCSPKFIFVLTLSLFGLTAHAREVCQDIEINTTGGCGSVNSSGGVCVTGKMEKQRICYQVPDEGAGPIPGGAGAGTGNVSSGSSGTSKQSCIALADGNKYFCDRDTLSYKKAEYLNCSKLFLVSNLLSQCNLLVDNEAKAKDLTCNFNYNNDIKKCDKL